MLYNIDNKNVFFNGKKIFEAPMDIYTILSNSFNDSAVIVYDAEPLLPDGPYPISLPPKLDDPELQRAINQNILCIDQTGNILWRVEESSQYPVFFNDIFERAGGIWAHRVDSYDVHIDRQTGRVIAQESTI